jgi:hypothetical protein
MFSGTLLANDLLMVRSQLPFPNAQPRLEAEINALGYFTSNADRVDINLVSVGFTHDIYRVIAYGKPEEIRFLANNYPELTPFLPPQIVVFGERNESLLVALSPLYLADYFQQPELVVIFKQWDKDLQTILENLRDAR